MMLLLMLVAAAAAGCAPGGPLLQSFYFDVNGAGGPTASGYTAVTVTGGAFTGTSGSVSISGTWQDSRDRSPTASSPSDMLRDFVFNDAVSSGSLTATVTISGVTGAYMVSSYSLDEENPIGPYNVYVSDARGTRQVVFSRSTAANENPYVADQFEIVGDGSDITLTYEAVESDPGRLRLNGLDLVGTCPSPTPSNPANDYCTLDINILPMDSAPVAGWTSLFLPTSEAESVGSEVTKGGVTFIVVDGTSPFDVAGSATNAWTSTGLKDNGSVPDYVGIAIVNLPVGTYDLEVFSYDPTAPSPHDIFYGTYNPAPNLPQTDLLGVNPATETPTQFQIESTDSTGTYLLAARSQVASLESAMNAFRFRLVDNEAPSIQCPPDQTVCLDETCSATLGLPCPTASDNCFGASTEQTSGVQDGFVFTQPTSVTNTFVVTDAAGLTDTCTTTIVVQDQIPPVLIGECPSGPITGVNDPSVCSSRQFLPTSSLTATDNCGVPELRFRIPGPTTSFPLQTGTYNPSSPTEVDLPVGDYLVTIEAVQPETEFGPEVTSDPSCEIAVDVDDVEPPTVCVPSHSVTLPCGGNSLAGWLDNYGWPIIEDNCGVNRGTFGANPNMDMYCGESPVRIDRSFFFTDFGGNTIQIGNVTYDTADASCTCDYVRPYEKFDTVVDTTNGQISERQIDRINDSNNRFQDCAPGTNCWCQETALFFDGAKKKKEIWIPGLLCYSYLGGIAAPGVPCKDQWKVSDNWSTADPNSAGYIISGNLPSEAPTPVFQALRGPYQSIQLIYDLVTGLTQPIAFDQAVNLSYGDDYVYTYVELAINCAQLPIDSGACLALGLGNKRSEGARFPPSVGPIPGPQTIGLTAIPGYYIITGEGCSEYRPFGPNGPVFWSGQNETCEVTYSNTFWPDLVGFIAYVNTPPTKRGEPTAATKRFLKVQKEHPSLTKRIEYPDTPAGPGKNFPASVPFEFGLFNIWEGIRQNYPRAQTFHEWLANELSVAFGWMMAANQGLPENSTGPGVKVGHKRSAPVPVPVPGPDRSYYFDCVRMGNTGYRYNITQVLLSQYIPPRP